MLADNTEINNILNNINLLNADVSYNNSSKKCRGRPRKELNNTQIVSKPKKRGRKPKENKLIINKNVNINEEIILHLPNITGSDLDKYGIDLIKNDKNESEHDEKDIFTIYDSDENDDNNNFNEEKNTLLDKIKSMSDKIISLENKLTDSNNENSNYVIDKHHVTKMNVNLVNQSDGQTFILETTDIACWWCTEQFTTIPCFIVCDIRNKSYVIFGCFCSYSCAVAFNINLDDFKMWNRHALTKQLFNELTNTTDNITSAPPRETLQKFGGHLTIEQFRRNSKVITKEYRCVVPPMMPVVPFIEENNTNIKKNINDTINTNDSELVMKRSKPLPGSTNNLLNAFNLKKK
jgi:hypothetical protein